jgi:hypothetical protein
MLLYDQFCFTRMIAVVSFSYFRSFSLVSVKPGIAINLETVLSQMPDVDFIAF